MQTLHYNSLYQDESANPVKASYLVTFPNGRSVKVEHASRAEARHQMLCVALGALMAGVSVGVTCPVNGSWFYNNDGKCAARVAAEIERINNIGA